MNKSLPIGLSFAIGIGTGMHPEILHLPHTATADFFTTAPQITVTASTSVTTGTMALWWPLT
jgi:hypothetical protein